MFSEDCTTDIYVNSPKGGVIVYIRAILRNDWKVLLVSNIYPIKDDYSLEYSVNYKGSAYFMHYLDNYLCVIFSDEDGEHCVPFAYKLVTNEDLALKAKQLADEKEAQQKAVSAAVGAETAQKISENSSKLIDGEGTLKIAKEQYKLLDKLHIQNEKTLRQNLENISKLRAQLDNLKDEIHLDTTGKVAVLWEKANTQLQTHIKNLENDTIKTQGARSMMNLLKGQLGEPEDNIADHREAEIEQRAEELFEKQALDKAVEERVKEKHIAEKLWYLPPEHLTKHVEYAKATTTDPTATYIGVKTF